MQHDIQTEEYEIIVVDNGSDKPVERPRCHEIAPNLTFIDSDVRSPSPCNALNAGLAAAKSDLILVMIDGARMTSPGLLKRAIEASQIGSRTIVGTVAFHLGPAIQAKSVQNEYNQSTENKLLASLDWEKDGYRLFGASVLAGSSAKGWHHLPKESNAVCMHRSIWQELDGYDVAFNSPGGGFANHDLWKRACELPDAQVIMLLGEATFHQFHGGVATNNPALS